MKTKDYPYRDKELPTSDRLADLLSRMTLSEKIGQMCQLDGRDDPIEQVRTKQPGSFLQVLGEGIDQIIDENEKTRLAIPILFGIDAIHGHSFWPGATIFPTQLGLASSWDVDLMRKVAEVTRKEMMDTGVSWTFSPVLCVTRDLRWGRVGETFGEDLLLLGTFARAMIEGYQGDDLSQGVLATAKHYAGYSETQGGRDASEADLSRRKLLSWFLPPFEQAIEANAGSFMTGYQSIEGQPSTANRWLLREVLRDRWGFDGVLVTDWDNVGRMVWEQKVCPDFMDASAKAIEAGNDIVMATPKFFQGALDAVSSGRVSEDLVDEAVSRILKVKFDLGLFENPRRPCAERSQVVIGASAHRDLALEAARKSITLLKNDGLLPLVNRETKLALIGPNSDDPLSLLGDWSLGTGQANNQSGASHPRESIVTVRDGLADIYPKLECAEGCRIVSEDQKTPEKGLELIPEAVALLERSDVAVVVVGDRHAFYGEYKSTATLELMGGQKELLREIVARKSPFVLVVQSSKPLVLPEEAVEAANAVIWLGCPGMLGGQALAEVVAGAVEPAGRLTLSWPKHVGQQPIFYSQVRGQHGNRYADLDQSPLFAFGEGLTYTKVEYEKLALESDEIVAGDSLKATVTLRNSGSRMASEVVQAYVRDRVTSVTWVSKSLATYQKVEIRPGESIEVALELPAESMTIVDLEGERRIEPGEFEIRVGPNSRDESHLVAAFSVRFEI